MYAHAPVKLLTARGLRGLTQRELAAKAGVSHVTIVKVDHQFLDRSQLFSSRGDDLLTDYAASG